jgi:hypothetical protein
MLKTIKIPPTDQPEIFAGALRLMGLDKFRDEIPVWSKLHSLNCRPMSSWTEQEIMEYSFMTGQGWTL